MKSFYSTLGVARTTEATAIKARWRELAHKLHPDRNGGDQHEFSMVSLAYSVLSDHLRKQKYDKQMELMTDACLYCQGFGRLEERQGFKKTGAYFICQECEGAGRILRK